jgi:alpha-glucosidase
MKIWFLRIVVFVLALGPVAMGPAIQAAEKDSVSLTSPDSKTTLTISVTNGQTVYSVKRGKETLVAPSSLGFRFKNMSDLGADMKITNSTFSKKDETWEQPWGERRFVRDNHNELFVELQENAASARRLNIRVRLFDDGLGFRYEFPEQDGIASTVIMDELTQFQFASDSRAWWIPAREYNRYEYIYSETAFADVKEVHTPITLKTPAGTYLSLHEAALTDYAGMTLLQTKGGKYEAHLAPWSNGDKVRTGASFVTPWRTIQISDSAAELLGSDLILNLNEPNKLGDVSWVEPGKYVGIWWEMHLATSTWGSGDKHGATTENTKHYIDFAAKYGFDGVLVEGWNTGWDGDWFSNGNVFNFTEAYPDYDLEALGRYARDRGVRLVGHHETSGGITNYERQMDDSFALLAKHGVAQVKTGYVAHAGTVMRTDENGEERKEFHDGQFMAGHFERALKSAAKHHISINSHEPIKDTGLRRTYPNWIAREGARGQEYNAWGSPANPPSHTAVLPYTRMLSGPMDFTPGIFDLIFEKEQPDNRVETTLAKQLALYVVIYSPIQMAADLPENYEKHMDAFQFIRDVPTDWEESIPLAGEIGDFVVIARKERGGNDWFMGGLAGDMARSHKQPLDFLDDGVRYEAQIYRDADDGHWDTNPYAMSITKQVVTRADSLTLPIAPGGGFAVRFKALAN